MQGAEGIESAADERARRKREAAATSRSEKRKRMGDAAYLQDKRETEQRRRHLKAAGHADAIDGDGDACIPTALAMPCRRSAALAGPATHSNSSHSHSHSKEEYAAIARSVDRPRPTRWLRGAST